MFYDQEQIRDILLNESAQDAIRILDGSDHGQGILENLRQTVEKQSEAIVKVALLLMHKKLITIDEAVDLFYPYV